MTMLRNKTIREIALFAFEQTKRHRRWVLPRVVLNLMLAIAWLAGVLYILHLAHRL